MPALDPTTTPSAAPIGQPLSRVDGRLKVTGRAVYAADTQMPNVTHAVLVGSPIAKGKIKAIDTTAAEASVGVLKVVTPMNMGHLPKPKKGNPLSGGGLIQEQRLPLQDKDIAYAGQFTAAVVAETLDQARHAATLLKFDFEEMPPALKSEEAKERRKPSQDNGQPLQVEKGHFAGAIKDAKDMGLTVLEATYDTPVETHNPMEMHATVAAWDGPAKLTVWDATQYIKGVQATLSSIFDLEKDSVRIINPFVGGGFGSKGAQWPHTILAAYLAKIVGRPVRLMLTRQQMFTNVGHRPSTKQAMTLAAAADGGLLAVGHDTHVCGSVTGEFIEPCGAGTSRTLYATPNMLIAHTLEQVNVGAPTFMRAPGEAPGMFALESAMDELAAALKVDPLALRLSNYANEHPQDGKPFSSKNLKEAYALGAAQFGWSQRDPTPGKTRTADGRRMGWGMATATYPANRFPGTARIRLMKGDDGKLRAVAASASHDLGTGAYTVFTQIAAAQVGLPPEQVKFELGDSVLPPGPVAGGSTSTASVGQALVDAGVQLREALLKIVRDSEVKMPSPLSGLTAQEVLLRDGKLMTADGRYGRDVLSILADGARAYVEGHAGPPATVGAVGQLTGEDYSKAMSKYALHSFGAHFVEVVIDHPCPRVIVKRVVSVMDVGTIINPKTARSQVIGGVVMGLGMALMEETIYDPRTGKPTTDNLADYPVCVNADVPTIDVHFVGKPDLHFNALGCRGVGEIGITGITAAVANAVFHATGRRVRDLPLTPDKLL